MAHIRKDGLEYNGKKSEARCLALLRRVAAGDSIKKSAKAQGVAYQTARNALQVFRRDIGAESVHHAVVLLYAKGLI